jgi:hypothetical protein
MIITCLVLRISSYVLKTTSYLFSCPYLIRRGQYMISNECIAIRIFLDFPDSVFFHIQCMKTN